MADSTPWFVYIIQASDASLYTGITTDVDRRFDEHLNSKAGAKFFNGRKPEAVVYRESVSNRSLASIREAQIKKMSRQLKLELVKNFESKYRMTHTSDLFANAEALPLVDGDLQIWHRINLNLSDSELLNYLLETVEWNQDEINLFGKRHLQPRMSAWYGDENLTYQYSGLTLSARPWLPILLDVKNCVEDLTGHHFNSLLLNYYRDQNDSMGMHSDDEIELGPEPVIASLSFGEERCLKFRHKFRRDIKTIKLPLRSGSLLLMSGTTQQFWKHGIAKERAKCGPRINLTFRQIKSENFR